MGGPSPRPSKAGKLTHLRLLVATPESQGPAARGCGRACRPPSPGPGLEEPRCITTWASRDSDLRADTQGNPLFVTGVCPRQDRSHGRLSMGRHIDVARRTPSTAYNTSHTDRVTLPRPNRSTLRRRCSTLLAFSVSTCQHPDSSDIRVAVHHRIPWSALSGPSVCAPSLCQPLSTLRSSRVHIASQVLVPTKPARPANL